MEVRNIRWVGVPTENYAAMRALLEQVMGLRLSFEEPTTVEFTTTEGDEVQLNGIAIVGDLGRDSRWEWIHFRAPDGNLYELARRASA